MSEVYSTAWKKGRTNKKIGRSIGEFAKAVRKQQLGYNL